MNQDQYPRHIVSIGEFTRQSIDAVLQSAYDIQQGLSGAHLNNKVIASCFFEASTRTRLSFESAVYRLGGHIIGFAEGGTTSLMQKGETLEDTIRMLDRYADAIIMRHPEAGAARKAASVAKVPVINAGDGHNQHPTQTLLDLYTIWRRHQIIDGLRVVICGDLKYGRTVHSLAQALALYDNISIDFVSPDGLEMPQEELSFLEKHNIHYTQTNDLFSVIETADVVYMTRIQKERLRLTEGFKPIELTRSSLARAKTNLCVLHPLPRQEELHHSVDETSHAVYFEQAGNGIVVRMALLNRLLNDS